MKFVIFCAMLFVLALNVEGKKKSWKEKKMKQMEMQLNDKMDNGGYGLHSKDERMSFGTFLPPRSKADKKFSRMRKNRRKFQRTAKWMHLRIGYPSECSPSCESDKVCVTNDMIAPICMTMKDFKKSMKIMHKYNKKDIKAWIKKFKSQKEEKYGRHNKHDLEALKMKKLKKLGKKNMNEKKSQKEENYGSFNKHDLEALKMKKLEKLGKYYNNMEEKRQKKKKYGRHNEHDLEALRMKKLEKLGKKYHDKKNMDRHNKHSNALPKYAGPVCRQGEFDQMRNRLVAWFHLLHGMDHKARKDHGGKLKDFYRHVSAKKELRELNGDKCQCVRSALWEFEQLDVDVDGQLSDKELALLEKNSLEPCARPFLQSCDRDGDKMIGQDEWCCCFSQISPPCYEKVKQIRMSGQKGTYKPNCDKEGYFHLEQCKQETDGSEICWCVDQSGIEYQDTARKGRAHCHKIDKLSYGKKETKLPLV